MDGDPRLLSPERTICFIALGSAGAIFQDNNQDQVVKAPLKHDITGCSQQVVESVKNRESFSELCINREKSIYQVLPKDPNILDCLAITQRGLQFPYHRLGNLRGYLQQHNKDPVSHIHNQSIQDRWIQNAIDAISTIHAYGVIHADISPRNFLVADDFSIKLCDFAGSAIGDLEPLVEEEDRYRLSPWTPRSFKTDLFALGCLIYEISTGVRPYNEIDDSDYEEIEKRYATQIFPSLDGLRYREIIFNCWTSQYASIDMLRADFDRCIRGSDGLDEPAKSRPRIQLSIFTRPFIKLGLGLLVLVLSFLGFTTSEIGWSKIWSVEPPLAVTSWLA